MKHAYLIIAHHNFDQLQILVNLLDDCRNTLFIHIDKKSDMPTIHSKVSDVIMIKKRIDTIWGDVSQIETELCLLNEACNHGNYDYYHLLSGVDLPIKSCDYIDNFFIKNKGKEFVGFSDSVHGERINQFHLLTKYNRTPGYIGAFIRRVGRCLEYLLNKSIKRSYVDCKKGSNWFSITDDFCRYLLERKSEILRRYRYTHCGDEFFLQTTLWNSPFRDNIYDLANEFNSCCREIDWTRGTPYVYKADDFEMLMNSKKLFARKFDIKEDAHIIKKIVDTIQDEN